MTVTGEPRLAPKARGDARQCAAMNTSSTAVYAHRRFGEMNARQQLEEIAKRMER